MQAMTSAAGSLPHSSGSASPGAPVPLTAPGAEPEPSKDEPSQKLLRSIRRALRLVEDARPASDGTATPSDASAPGMHPALLGAALGAEVIADLAAHSTEIREEALSNGAGEVVDSVLFGLWVEPGGRSGFGKITAEDAAFVLRFVMLLHFAIHRISWLMHGSAVADGKLCITMFWIRAFWVPIMTVIADACGHRVCMAIVDAVPFVAEPSAWSENKASLREVWEPFISRTFRCLVEGPVGEHCDLAIASRHIGHRFERFAVDWLAGAEWIGSDALGIHDDFFGGADLHLRRLRHGRLLYVLTHPSRPPATLQAAAILVTFAYIARVDLPVARLLRDDADARRELRTVVESYTRTRNLAAIAERDLTARTVLEALLRRGDGAAVELWDAREDDEAEGRPLWHVLECLRHKEDTAAKRILDSCLEQQREPTAAEMPTLNSSVCNYLEHSFVGRIGGPIGGPRAFETFEARGAAKGVSGADAWAAGLQENDPRSPRTIRADAQSNRTRGGEVGGPRVFEAFEARGAAKGVSGADAWAAGLQESDPRSPRTIRADAQSNRTRGGEVGGPRVFETFEARGAAKGVSGADAWAAGLQENDPRSPRTIRADARANREANIPKRRLESETGLHDVDPLPAGCLHELSRKDCERIASAHRSLRKVREELLIAEFDELLALEQEELRMLQLEELLLRKAEQLMKLKYERLLELKLRRRIASLAAAVPGKQ